MEQNGTSKLQASVIFDYKYVNNDDHSLFNTSGVNSKEYIDSEKGVGLDFEQGAPR